MKFRHRRRRQARIPVVSMADIAFLLIIFFICTTSFGRESGLQLKLPGAQSPDQLPTQKEISISIDKFKQIRVDQQEVLLEYLPTVLYEKLSRMPEGARQIMIRADESIDWGTVVKVMDVPKTIEEETGWPVGINVAVANLSPSEKEKDTEPFLPDETGQSNPDAGDTSATKTETE
jgi:biopolymer transport protein ExbD